MKIEIRKSPIQGIGVFATRPIARGEVIHEIDDSRVVDEKHPVREDLGEDPRHCSYLPDGTTVLMHKPAGRFNHSCNPNIFMYSVDRQRFILTMRDISAGEELLFDYSIGAVGGKVWQCNCGSSNCRGLHKCDFFALPTERQLAYLPYVDPWFASVHKDRILKLLQSRSSRR